MIIFLKNLEGDSTVYDVDPCNAVEHLKADIADKEGIPTSEQRIIFAGRHLEDGHLLEDYGIDSNVTLHLALRLLGAGKKRKKKVYTTPKKIKHKRKKVKLATLKYYKIDEDGNINRLRTECNNVSCGGGVFMAKHKDRLYCGRCHQTLVEKK